MELTKPTPAQMYHDSDVSQKFAIGETAYMEQTNRKGIEDNKIPLIPILIQSTFVTRIGGTRVYEFEGGDKRIYSNTQAHQDSLLSASEAEQKVAENPEIYSIQE